MHLTTLTVRDFRNLVSLDVELPAPGVVVLGENGHGKTNLLEAMYYLVLFRSVRGAKDRELVRFAQDGFFVAGTADRHVTAGYQLAERRKKVTVDGNEVRKLAEAAGQIAAVLFSPDDRSIIAGGPAGRRRFLDILLSLTRAGYLTALASMRTGLRQRNAALRRGNALAAQAFDEQLAQSASVIAGARRAWADCWGGRYSTLCTDLGERGATTMAYHAHRHRGDDEAETFSRELGEALDRDLQRGMTTVGPHRDDLRLDLDGHDLRRYGSAGQQRTAAVALRLLEALGLSEAMGTPPIALYDDVFAEFDAERQGNLLQLIQDTLPGQAIIAAPRESEVPGELLDRPRWTMEHGILETSKT